MNIKEYKEKLFKSDTRKRLIENFLSLSVLQIANYILPLITLPYLVRVLGPEKFGLIAFSQAFIGYFMILTDYGFNLSATRDISINRENKEKVSEIFSSVMIIKLALMIISLILMSIIIFYFEKFRQNWIVYYLTFGMVVGQVLFPTWFFQGMEKMKYITFLNILAKVIFTVAIFVFVKEASDYLYVPLLNSLGFIIAGILGLWIVFRNFEAGFKFVSLKELKRQLKEGLYIFISEISGNIYGRGTIIIIGLVSNNTIVGYYSVAERVMKAVAGLSQPFAQALYPYVMRTKFNSFKTVFKYSFIVSLFISIFLYLFSEIIIEFFKIHNKDAVLTLKILSMTLFFTFLNVIKQPYIYACKMDKYNLQMYVFTGISFMPICIYLSLKLSLIGTALSLLYVEIMIFIIGLILIYICKNELRS
ncbi:polysaccharide biosynthesis protein [Sulfurihydrogenibium sp. YO3AOP1]|uniref:flippase n=1 Tax=Sulfurihydrogenibium sp. (strain YO3AOP1) TaxID=436114 RepID=UPI0001750BF2|nr:flippase [Sulfurihydrogenibium sp. YO3AOP1]ACD67010.1 polysaccharide biosynthesis protein [Sulfurihydrogenibium sp. YO3AOP1]